MGPALPVPFLFLFLYPTALGNPWIAASGTRSFCALYANFI